MNVFLLMTRSPVAEAGLSPRRLTWQVWGVTVLHIPSEIHQVAGVSNQVIGLRKTFSLSQFKNLRKLDELDQSVEVATQNRERRGHASLQA